MSKNTQISNYVLKIIQEKRIKGNVVAKSVIINKDNGMNIIMNLTEIVVERKRRDRKGGEGTANITMILLR